METRLTLPIDGMTCAACANRVERGLSTVDGVHGATVNFATGEAAVSFDPDVATPRGLAEAVEATGYGVRPTTLRVPLGVSAGQSDLDAWLAGTPGVLGATLEGRTAVV